MRQTIEISHYFYGMLMLHVKYATISIKFIEFSIKLVTRNITVTVIVT